MPMNQAVAEDDDRVSAEELREAWRVLSQRSASRDSCSCHAARPKSSSSR